jgi:bacterioferritin-associated ferredoxin
MLLCLCKGVSDRVVRLAVANGAGTIDGVAARCGAGTDCGACRPMIHELIEEAETERAASAAMDGRGCCEGEAASPSLQAASGA